MTNHNSNRRQTASKSRNSRSGKGFAKNCQSIERQEAKRNGIRQIHHPEAIEALKQQSRIDREFLLSRGALALVRPAVASDQFANPRIKLGDCVSVFLHPDDLTTIFINATQFRVSSPTAVGLDVPRLRRLLSIAGRQ